MPFVEIIEFDGTLWNEVEQDLVLFKDVNECSNIRIFVFRSNIRIRFLNSNIHIFICPRAVLLLSFQMKNYRPALKGG